jgi:hypothetical protein
MKNPFSIEIKRPSPKNVLKTIDISKRKKVQTKYRWYPKKTAAGETISTPKSIDLSSIDTITPDIAPVKNVESMTYAELQQRFKLPKEYDIYRNPVRNENAYAVGIWLAKRKITPKTKKTKQKPRKKSRSEYYYEEETPTCPVCNSYMDYINGGYTCPDCDY